MGHDDSPPPLGFRSITTRLITWVLICCGAVYLLTLALSHSWARAMTLGAAEREADYEAEAAVNQVQEVLRSVEESTDLLATALEAFDPTEASLEALLSGFVAGNLHIYGSTASFEKGAFRPDLDRFAPYYHRRADGSDEILFVELSQSYDYRESEWYEATAATGEARWSEPYFDEGGGDVTMVTYSVPFFRQIEGRRQLRGVVTADLHLDWLHRLVDSVRIGQTGYGVVLTGSGRVLAHGRPGVVEPGAPLLARMDPAARAEVEPILEKMLARQSGFGPIGVDGRTYRLSYAPVGSAGWTVAVMYPEDEMLEAVRRLRALQAGLVLAGLGALSLVVVVVSRRLTRPLKALARSADRIATGDLDLTLPAAASRDEVGTLTSTFHHMRDSLKAHIRDLQVTTAAKERLESELRVARKIQMDMLPRGDAGGPAEGYALAARLVSARDVGGDLYDHFVQEGKLFFLVGDVSGKGVPAALFMARTRTLFQSVVAREVDPGGTLRAMNDGLRVDNDAGMFVTVVCGVLDLGIGELTFASGGHDAPLMVPSDGPPEFLEVEGGPALGLLEDRDFPLNRLRLAPGDAVVLYTDGVTEAQNAGEAFFGVEGLLAAARRFGPEGATALTEGLLGAVREFAGDAPQADDITVMTLSYSPGRE